MKRLLSVVKPVENGEDSLRLHLSLVGAQPLCGAPCSFRGEAGGNGRQLPGGRQQEGKRRLEGSGTE